MNILAIETSAKAASVALVRDGVLLSMYFQNNGQTHSKTVMPMLESMLEHIELSIDDIECVAVAAGPGSFTGLRIGMSIVKGLAWKNDLPCCAVSSLEAMAWQLSYAEGIICSVMDARRNQVYNGIFKAQDGRIERLREDCAISIDDLAEQLKLFDVPIYLVGDGSEVCFEQLKNCGIQLKTLPNQFVMQNAWGVAKAAEAAVKRNETTTAEALTPIYLRLPQAERERLERLKKE